MPNGADLVAILLGALALAFAGGLFASFASLRRRLLLVRGRGGETDIIEAVARQVEEVKALRAELRSLLGDLSSLHQTFEGAVQRFAVFRYDAFEDMGGKLSFSAALLNNRGDGIVISCINGRQEARSYAKPVLKGNSVYNLSPEESEAIRQAMSNNKQ